MLTDTQRDTIVAALEHYDEWISDLDSMAFYEDKAESAQLLTSIRDALAAVNAMAGVEVVPLNTRADLPGGGRWYVCDDGEIAMVYPDMGVRAPLPKGWALIRTSEGGGDARGRGLCWARLQVWQSLHD